MIDSGSCELVMNLHGANGSPEKEGAGGGGAVEMTGGGWCYLCAGEMRKGLEYG